MTHHHVPVTGAGLTSPVTVDAIRRSLYAGVATGGRTFTGFAALAATTPRDATTQPDAVLAKPAVQAAVAVLAAVEIIADKLPQAPSRLQAPGLAGRLVLAAACGAVITRRAAAMPTEPLDEPDTTDPPDHRLRDVLCVGSAVGAAAAAAVVGVRWRAWCARGSLTSFLGAAAEDAVLVGLAGAAAR